MGTLPPEQVDNVGVVYPGGTHQSPTYKLAGDNYSLWPPDNGNETFLGDERPLMFVIPIASAMSFLSIITALGNLLVIHAIRTEKRLQTVANYFICSLSVADLLIGIFVMPLSVVSFVTGDWHLGLIVCQAWLSVDYVCSTASIYNLFILSLDRYWSIRYPLKYLRFRTTKRAKRMITLVWAVSSIWIIPVVGWHVFEGHGERLVPSNQCDTEFRYNTIFKVITAIGNFYVPMGIMIGIYCKIFHEIRKRSMLQLQGHRSTGQGSRRSKVTTTGAEVVNEPPPDVPNEDDSSSSSKDTSGEQGESLSRSNSGKIKGVQPPINLQLKKISHLTFLTMGLHPGMLDGKSSPIREPQKVSSKKNKLDHKLDHSNCSCSRVTARPKSPLSKEESKLPDEHHRNKNLLSVNYIPKNKLSEQLREELQPLREQDEGVSVSSNGRQRSILRRSNTAEQIYNGAPKVRRISFTSADDANWRDCKVTYKEGFIAGRKITAAEAGENVQIHEPRRQPPTSNRGIRNGTVCRLLSNDTTTSGSGGTDSGYDDGGSPRGVKGQDGPPNKRFSRFGTSIRQGPGRASETLKRIRKMSISKEKKAAKQLGIIVGCFVSCWLPYFIAFMIVAFCHDCIPPQVYNALIWLGYINSTLNPFIYPMCNTNFRKAFKKILHIGKDTTRQRR